MIYVAEKEGAKMGKSKHKRGKKECKTYKAPSLLLWLLGYYTVEIPRPFFEDFLNLCLRYNFSYYDVNIDEDKRSVSLIVALPQLKNVLTACRMWQIRIKVVSGHGLPQRLLKYKGRYGLLVGSVLAVALFVLSQSVIWRIDVTGNSDLSTEQVLESLNENGLHVGSYISSLKTDSIEQRIMISNDRIAWMSINILGTVAHVEIREVLDTEIKEENKTPANLVAAFDAQIVGMEVYSGFLSVKEGDFVRKGELLVSGVHKEGKSPLRFSRASGRIFGRISHTFEIEIPLVQSKKVYLDEKIEKKTLIFFGKPIKFFLNYRNLPTSYDIINYIYTFDPFSLGELPISLSVDEYLAYEMRDVDISEGEAIDFAYKELRRRIDEELPDATILKKVLHGEVSEGKYVLKCTVTAICNIARQVEFEVSNLSSD